MKSKRIEQIGWSILLCVIAIAIFAPFIAPYSPYEKTGQPFQAPNSLHYLGTNDIGQDIFSELIFGTRTSLTIGFISSFISVAIGTVIGLISGFYGGRIDRCLMKLTAFFMTIPYLPSIIILAAFTKPNILTTSIILGIMSFCTNARLIRSETIRIKQKEYIRSIQAMGASSYYIIKKHIAKEVAPLIQYRFMIRVKSGILAEAGLSFLGLGNPASKSWGTMIYYAQEKSALLTDAWLWWLLPPGIAIALVSSALMMISFGREEVMDRRLKENH